MENGSGKGTSGTAKKFWCLPRGNDNALEVNFTQGNKCKSAIGKTPTAEGKWNHVAATSDGEKLRAYLDGQLESETHQPNCSMRPDDYTRILRAFW